MIFSRSWLLAAVLGGVLVCAPPVTSQEQWEALNSQGVTLYQQGRYGEAIDVLSDAIVQHPEEAVLYFNRALARIAQNSDEWAQNDLTRAINLDPTNATYHLQYGYLRRQEEPDYVASDRRGFPIAAELLPENEEVQTINSQIYLMNLQRKEENPLGPGLSLRTSAYMEVVYDAYDANIRCLERFPHNRSCQQDFLELTYIFVTDRFRFRDSPPPRGFFGITFFQDFREDDDYFVFNRDVPVDSPFYDEVLPYDTSQELLSKLNTECIEAYEEALRTTPTVEYYLRLSDCQWGLARSSNDDFTDVLETTERILQLDLTVTQANKVRRRRRGIFEFLGMHERAREERQHMVSE